jgi:Gpi18-like mannosyltransferase
MAKIDAVPAGATTFDFSTVSSSSSSAADETGAPKRNTEAWLLAAFGIALAAVALMRKSGRTPLDRDARHYEILFALVILVAVAARLFIASTVYGYHTDINCFTAWSERIYSVGYTHFYAADYFCDYPPLYMAMLWFVAAVRNLFGIAYGSTAHVLLVKLIPILADAVMAYLVYFFAKKRANPRAAMLLGAVCALNPAAIVDSAAWGQIDSVFTIFIALGAVLLSEGAYGWALPMFTFSMLMKPQALLFAPLGLVAVVANLAWKPEKKKALGAAYGLGVSLALLLLAGLIFHEDGVGPVKWLYSLYSGTMNSYENFTINALNLYQFLGLNWVGLSDHAALSVFAFILFALSYVYAFALYLRAQKPSAIFMTGAVLIMLICAFGPMIHERYSYPALVLLLLAYAAEKDRRILVSLAVLTVTLFLNQILVLQGGMTAANYGHLQTAEDWLNIPLSFLVVANAVYAGYVAFSMYFMNKRVPLDAEPLDGPTPVREGLFGRRDYRLNLKRWDYLAMAGVTVAYSILTFVNLGTTSAPQTSWVSSRDGEQVVFDLGATETFRMEYYGGICDTNFTVELSNDGATWTEPQYAVYDQGEIFRWIFYVPSTGDSDQKPVYGETVPTTDGSAYTVFATGTDKFPYQTARYVRITAVTEGFILSEVGFLDADGAPYPVSILSQTGYAEEAKTDARALVDEQNTVPGHPSYYNSTYFDEIYHARTAYEHLNGLHAYEWTHPPLGKVLMMVGVEIFGMTPFGWRFMGALMGVLMLPVIYLMVKQLGGSRKISALAMILFALDSMHFTQTRIATIDSYAVFWIMLMYLFMFRYVRMSFHRQPLIRTLVPLMLCGMTMGIAWATKWIGIYASAGLAVLFFWSLISRYREHLEALRHEGDQFESDEERRALLEEIQSGTFAREWIAEMDAGEPRLRALRAEAADLEIERVGKELRALMRRETAEVPAGR